MILKNLKIYVLLLAMTGLFSSCFDSEAVDLGKGPHVVQFEKLSASENFLQDENNTVYDYTIPVELFGGDGGPIGSDVTFTVEADASSTAVEGEDFDFVSTSGTIPAGELVGNVAIKVYSENLDATDPEVLVLNIVSSSETVSSNNSTSLTLQAVCPSELAGTYYYTNIGPDEPVEVTSTGTGTYTVSRDNYFAADYPFSISDVCGTITVTDAYIENQFGIATSGSGTLNDDGTITINYTVDGYISNRPMTLMPM